MATVLSDDQIKLRISFQSTAVNQTRSYDNQCGRGLVNPKVYKKHARNSTKINSWSYRYDKVFDLGPFEDLKT